MTDAELVVRARLGDGEAFGYLADRYYPDCLRFARWMLGDHHLAEDAVQDSFLRAFQALPRYSERHRFRAWLFQILVNRCRSHRSRWRRWLSRHTMVEEAGEIDGTPSEVDPAEIEAIHHALAALPAALREAFLLKHGEGFSYEEMADLTGTSVSALKMRVKRARDHVRGHLGGTTDGDT